MRSLHLFNDSKNVITAEIGKIIFERNTPAEEMYVLLEGAVTFVRDGLEFITVGPGNIFGEMVMLEHRPHYVTAVAKTPCKILTVSRERFNELLEQHPSLALEMLELMAGRLHEAVEVIAQSNQ